MSNSRKTKKSIASREPEKTIASRDDGASRGAVEATKSSMLAATSIESKSAVFRIEEIDVAPAESLMTMRC